jgi:FkbM family methyltransferase
MALIGIKNLTKAFPKYEIFRKLCEESHLRLNQPLFMRKLILRLTGSETIRTIVKILRLHLLANWWLHCFPVVKNLSASGIRYRARRVESLGLSVEMFDDGKLYSISDLPSNIHTFADLGCNAGYFTCWLCDRLKNRQIKGLMVDANAEAVEDAEWHVRMNNLNGVHVLHGLLGVESESGRADFFLHVSNVCSTAVPQDEAMNQNHTWTRVQVPCIKLEENWHSRFGNIPCDLLKIDIEGSEMDFFRKEPIFLQRTKAILIEWHKWHVDFKEIETFLSERNFTLKIILHEGDNLGTALFVREN